MRFRHKPIEIEAWQYTGENAAELHAIFGLMKTDLPRRAIGVYDKAAFGYRLVEVGDWIIGEARGDKTVCKPDVFAATYEPAAALNERERAQ